MSLEILCLLALCVLIGAGVVLIVSAICALEEELEELRRDTRRTEDDGK